MGRKRTATRERRTPEQVAAEGSTITIAAAFPPDLAAHLKTLRGTTGRSVSSMIVEAVRLWMDPPASAGPIGNGPSPRALPDAGAAAEDLAGLSPADREAIEKYQREIAEGGSGFTPSADSVRPPPLPTLPEIPWQDLPQ
jgi:hypothetical protein